MPLTVCPSCGAHAPPRTCSCPECGAKVASCSSPSLTLAAVLLGLSGCPFVAPPQSDYGVSSGYTTPTGETGEIADTSDTGTEP